MATLSSILSWRIPWREEPGGLQFIGSAKSQAPLKQGSTQAHKEHDCVCVCMCVCVCVCVCVRSVTQSCPTLTPWTGAHWAPISLKVSKQES